MDHPRLVWARIGDRYPDLVDEPDSFIALDGDARAGGARTRCLLGRFPGVVRARIDPMRVNGSPAG